MASVRSRVFRLGRQPYLLLTLTALFWAGNAVAGRLSVGEISPFVLTFLRWVMVAGVMLTLFAREMLCYWPVVRKHLLVMTLMAALGLTGFNTLFYLAAHKTTAVNIGILQGSIPIIVLVSAVLCFGTKISLLQAIGALVTFTGVATVATDGQPHRLLELSLNPGDAIMLTACVLYAGYTVALKRRPPIPGLVFFAYLSIVAAIASMPLVLTEAVGGGFEWPTMQGWLVTLYVAIAPSCLAQIFFIRGVELIGPERAGLFVNLVPVFAAFLAVAILAEPFHLFHAIALGMVLAGIGLAEHGRARLP